MPPVLRVVLAAGWSDPPGPFRTSPYPGILADCFPQQKVFQDELPFARNECSTAKTACCFKVDGLGPCFGSDDLVQSIAVWAAEKRRCIRTGHERSQQLFAKLLASRPAKRVATTLKSASARRCTALTHIRNGLMLRSTDQKTMVEKSTNDRSAI
jgi:hypothetical protein